MEIAVIGKVDFCLGFRLTGIKKVIETENPQEAIEKVREDGSAGVVVFDEKLLEKLDDDEKQSLEDSLNPVFLMLSTKASEDSLKKMIRKSIGVEI